MIGSLLYVQLSPRRWSSGKADSRTFELRSSFCSFRAISTHPKAFPADGDAIVSDCEVVFINRWMTAFSVQVNKNIIVCNTDGGSSVFERFQHTFPSPFYNLKPVEIRQERSFLYDSNIGIRQKEGERKDTSM